MLFNYISGAWANEVDQYNYNGNSCSSGMCGHYTQMIWSNTGRVGCGTAKCPSLKILGGLAGQVSLEFSASIYIYAYIQVLCILTFIRAHSVTHTALLTTHNALFTTLKHDMITDLGVQILKPRQLRWTTTLCSWPKAIK
jgi:Cysteine-rich secretory protein family